MTLQGYTKSYPSTLQALAINQMARELILQIVDAADSRFTVRSVSGNPLRTRMSRERIPQIADAADSHGHLTMFFARTGGGGGGGEMFWNFYVIHI